MAISTTTFIFICLLIGRCTCKNTAVFNSNLENEEDELLSVVVLYRHGDTSPTGSFPTDPYYNSSYWPEGYGQLLRKGILRQFNLGQWLRNRYDTFLPAEYSPKDILVYSTDVDRTLMSAEANIAGLYPIQKSQIWQEGFLWDPIPVHSIPTSDPILTLSSPCRKFDRLLKELESSEFFQNVSNKNAYLFDQLSGYTGKAVSSIEDVSSIYDVLYVYRNHNESYLPSWVNYIDPDRFKSLAGLNFARATFTDDLKRLRAGPFVNFIIKRFDDVVTNAADTVKFLMFSVNDATLSTALGGMNVFDDYPPEFAAAAMFELRKNNERGHYVNVLHRVNSDDAYGRLLSVNHCDSDCKFDELKKKLESVNVDIETWQIECQDTSSKSIPIVISGALIFLLITLHLLV